MMARRTIASRINRNRPWISGMILRMLVAPRWLDVCRGL
jgi:hypothetical protein